MKKDNKSLAFDGVQDKGRRDFLLISAGTFAVAGGVSFLWPFVAQMNPSADVLALSTTEVDLSPIEEGQSLTVLWQGKPVFVRHRTKEEILAAQSGDEAKTPDPATDKSRVLNPKWLVVVGVCTHLGCVPLGAKGDYNGWFCPCHGSHYDTSGRVRKGPAPKNLPIPPYTFVDDTTIVIGIKEQEG